MHLDKSQPGEKAAERGSCSLVPEASSKQGYQNRELAADSENLRFVSDVAAPPRDSTLPREPTRSTRPIDSLPREPSYTEAHTVAQDLGTSSSATKVSSLDTNSAMSSPHGGSSDSEPEDPSTTPKPSDSTPGQSANVEGKPSEQPEGSSDTLMKDLISVLQGLVRDTIFAWGSVTITVFKCMTKLRQVAGAAAVAIAPVALAAVGFTSSGVAAGSLAAAYQATLGGFIAKGSVFALLQSFGAAGIPAAVQTGIAAIGAAGAGGVTALS
ncbi:hypothetical protein HPB51_026452 [Rhipicephalus microplus]|uniref:Interferon alpha-inducible protein n=1 Tax=Rhipicephalus microplus TaxID=6941 RepID=A0A9J6D3M0_RHIMP|nr:hypothetical protein HPB51_026452 [Rhipicephalus microplus]